MSADLTVRTSRIGVRRVLDRWCVSGLQTCCAGANPACGTTPLPKSFFVTFTGFPWYCGKANYQNNILTPFDYNLLAFSGFGNTSYRVSYVTPYEDTGSYSDGTGDHTYTVRGHVYALANSMKISPTKVYTGSATVTSASDTPSWSEDNPDPSWGVFEPVNGSFNPAFGGCELTWGLRNKTNWYPWESGLSTIGTDDLWAEQAPCQFWIPCDAQSVGGPADLTCTNHAPYGGLIWGSLGTGGISSAIPPGQGTPFGDDHTTCLANGTDTVFNPLGSFAQQSTFSLNFGVFIQLLVFVVCEYKRDDQPFKPSYIYRAGENPLAPLGTCTGIPLGIPMWFMPITHVISGSSFNQSRVQRNCFNAWLGQPPDPSYFPQVSTYRRGSQKYVYTFHHFVNNYGPDHLTTVVGEGDGLCNPDQGGGADYYADPLWSVPYSMVYGAYNANTRLGFSSPITGDILDGPIPTTARIEVTA